MDNDSIPMKHCARCGEDKPATAEHFSRNKRMKDGLNCWCKVCLAQYQKEYKSIPENKNRLKEYYTRYYQENKVRVTKLRNRRYSENKQQHSEYGRKYRMNNPENSRIRASRRRARKRQLPDTFTPEQWLACLEYFNYCCAVCGSQLRDLFGNVEPQADHWIPLNDPDCPGTVTDNMVCLCNVCNRAKWYKLPHVWLKEQFGSRKANEIMARIQAYFDSIDNRTKRNSR